MWWRHYPRNHVGHDKTQFVAVATGGFRHSMCIPWEVANHLGSMISETIKLEAPNGIFLIGVCRKTGELVLRAGWDKFVAMHHIKENYSFWFVYRGNSTFKVHIFNSNGHEKATSCSKPPSESFGGVPPAATCDHHVLNEQVPSVSGNVQTSTDSGYSMLPGCHLTKAQDDKVRELACTMRSQVPLYVAVMNKSNVNLKDCSVNLPLKLVEHFKEDTSKATIQLEAPNDMIYGVEACKHGDDQIVLQYGWNNLVDANRIQENDLLVFITKGTKRLEVRILGTSVHQRTSSCFDVGNISSTQEIREDSLEITDPPPHTDYYVSSSDDDHIMEEGYYVSSSDDDHIAEEDYVSSSDADHIVEEGTRKSGRRQKQAPSRYAKAQKVASTSSPSAAKSGYEAHKLNERASVEFGINLEPHSSTSNLEGPSQYPYVLSEGRTSLSSVEKEKVEEKVQAIQSELPIFVVVMTKSRINADQLGFRMEYGARHIPHIGRKMDLMLQAEGGTEQRTRLVIDQNGKRWIRRGWQQFVTENKVREGDICLFERGESTKKLRMTVYFIRKSSQT
ncbi:B3 domain-containing protein LOC_Os12g40080-like [Triticum urartu]|uniref:TF-B3 domain-containing protein n=1 Tax=Triticum urartu TaxID=4572 RepID=A0A8R7PZ69_TRIUA|nr:B3 domain-containing protein LOC_Os12g40080-like [Triticum urartu]XP_048569211.1 B3 domain-containing protein LOC_Os12g40080-like [Triticum urartu]